MGDRTLTRADLAEAVFRKIGLSRTESAYLVESVLEEICTTIAKGEAVKISSFGSFLVRNKNDARGAHPKTGEEVPISPRRVAVFKTVQRHEGSHPRGARPAHRNGAAGSEGRRVMARAG